MLVKLGGVIDKCKGGGVMYDGKGGSVENEKKRGGECMLEGDGVRK